MFIPGTLCSRYQSLIVPHQLGGIRDELPRSTMLFNDAARYSIPVAFPDPHPDDVLLYSSCPCVIFASGLIEPLLIDRKM